jgi:hypothetical protein
MRTVVLLSIRSQVQALPGSPNFQLVTGQHIEMCVGPSCRELRLYAQWCAFIRSGFGVNEGAA